VRLRRTKTTLLEVPDEMFYILGHRCTSCHSDRWCLGSCFSIYLGDCMTVGVVASFLSLAHKDEEKNIQP
jgi:hypothetical protein